MAAEQLGLGLAPSAGATISPCGRYRAKNGDPRHPLMLAYSIELEPFQLGQ